MSVGMTPEMRALAERAVKCEGWRLCRGMTATDGVRVVVVTAGECTWEEDRGECHGMPCVETMYDPAGGIVVNGPGAFGHINIGGRGWLPDLTDPATLGCLLALVREAWGAAATVGSDSTTGAAPARWWVRLGDDARTVVGAGPTEAHALVAALEAAP